ncbi:hypothetical protein IFM89_011176 [Coptis chinensis]|uniref:Uncharacterized protein n=1 Tax=Coptis chinensis TaxID=261450 RepID=A0A835HUG0_9MAGN|nr:hypothetical protein IFM89_011176 [Coptis chinensis]
MKFLGMKTDCVGCFDLVNGTEKYRFVQAKSKNDFLVDDVMDLGSGGIRIGLDIGGGSGTFAAMMHGREKYEEKKMTLTRVIEQFGYKKLKWVVGENIVSSG